MALGGDLVPVAQPGSDSGRVLATARAAAPYAGLTPEVVLGALESVGLQGDGRMLALNSYENRVYRLSIENGPPCVAKFYRPDRWSDAQIVEEHDFVGELAKREIPVVAPFAFTGGATLQRFADYRFAVYPLCGGRAPELDQGDTREWLGRYIGRIHAVGSAGCFVARPRLDIASFGEEPRDWLLANDFIPADLLDAYRSVAAQALAGVTACFARAGDVGMLRLHGDCHASNVLWIPDGALAGPHFVDFDDSRTGPAVQDLWMLLSGERREMSRQLTKILEGYEDFMTFDRRELHLVEALRTLRLIHYSAWIARRWNDPAFPAAFPWFNTQRYWQDRILELREQIALMDEGPLEP